MNWRSSSVHHPEDVQHRRGWKLGRSEKSAPPARFRGTRLVRTSDAQISQTSVGSTRVQALLSLRDRRPTGRKESTRELLRDRAGDFDKPARKLARRNRRVGLPEQCCWRLRVMKRAL